MRLAVKIITVTNKHGPRREIAIKQTSYVRNTVIARWFLNLSPRYHCTGCENATFPKAGSPRIPAHPRGDHLLLVKY
jgi:hypothetical protein